MLSLKLIFAFLLAVLTTAASANEWRGTVVGVSDGDTVTVLSQQKRQVKVRLVEIDAPEKKQTFGQQSKKSLSDICYKKPVIVNQKGTDRYRRTLARLTCDGIDANAEQVKRGMAWAFSKYLTDLAIADLEKVARNAKIGLWAQPNPTAPWDFRHPERKTAATLTTLPESEIFSCEGRNARCKSMKTCAEAMYYLKECGADKLDRDGDGIPCEAICSK